MALPPEPLEVHLARVDRAFVGLVLSTVDAPDAEGGDLDDDAYIVASGIGGARPRAKQRVRVQVQRVLHGPIAAASDVELLKPESAYLLTSGMGGVFVVDGAGVILGRYGPRTWSEPAVVAALNAWRPEGRTTPTSDGAS